MRAILQCKNPTIAVGRSSCVMACGTTMEVKGWALSHLHRSQLATSQKSKFGKQFLNSITFENVTLVNTFVNITSFTANNLIVVFNIDKKKFF